MTFFFNPNLHKKIEQKITTDGTFILQNNMTEIWPRGQNNIWYIEPGVKIPLKTKNYEKSPPKNNDWIVYFGFTHKKKSTNKQI